jgi:hypothetical protein
MFKNIKAVWQAFNGSKTVIASIYWGSVLPSLLLIYPAGIPANVSKWTTIIGFFLTSVGLGHKWYKKTAEKDQ